MRTVDKFLLKLSQRNHVYETQQTAASYQTQRRYAAVAKHRKTSKQGNTGSMKLVQSVGKYATGAKGRKTGVGLVTIDWL